MARAYLRYAPEGDERPEPLSKPVVDRALESRLVDVKAWLKPRMPTLTDSDIMFAVASALKGSGADAFRAGVILKDMFSWPVDIDLIMVLRDAIQGLAIALKIETGLWVLRVGLRFPGKDGDTIEWEDEFGKARAGTIKTIDATYAQALVQPPDGLTKVHKPVRVCAETVTANITQADYPKIIPLAANGAS